MSSEVQSDLPCYFSLASSPIAIVGGGLAGLATAAALVQKGVPVRVFERDPRGARPQGYALGIREHGWAALRTLGVATDTLRKDATSLTTFDMTTTERKMLMRLRIPPGSTMESLSVSRPALHTALKKLIPDDVIEYGKQLSRYSINPDGTTTLHFVDNSIAQCSLLIAADGTRSVVRKQLLPGDAGQRDFAGYAQVGGRVSNTSLVAYSPPLSEMILSRNGCSLFFMPLGNSDEHLWALILRCDAENLARLSEMSQSELKSFVTEKIKGWKHPLKDIVLTHSIESPIHVTGYHFHAPQKLVSLQKSTDRVILIGDAAHSMTPLQGEGGNTALQDGVHVGTCLANALASPEGITLDTLQKIRREISERSAPRVTRSQHAASMFTLSNYTLCVLRDWLMWFFYVIWLRRLEKK